MSVLERIREAAKAKGWDRMKVAVVAGIERSQIYQISASKRGTSKHLPKIAEALGVEIDQLTGAKPIPQPIPADTATAILSELKELRAKITEMEKRMAGNDAMYAELENERQRFMAWKSDNRRRMEAEAEARKQQRKQQLTK